MSKPETVMITKSEYTALCLAAGSPIPSPSSHVVGSAEEILAASDAHDDESLWRFWNEKARSQAVETDRLRLMVERRDAFIIANGLWDVFKEALSDE